MNIGSGKEISGCLPAVAFAAFGILDLGNRYCVAPPSQNII
jgi:hypothetical protein